MHRFKGSTLLARNVSLNTVLYNKWIEGPYKAGRPVPPSSDYIGEIKLLPVGNS